MTEPRTMQFLVERDCPHWPAGLAGVPLPLMVWVVCECKTDPECGGRMWPIAPWMPVENTDGPTLNWPAFVAKFDPDPLADPAVCEHMGRLVE
jgi:hypothetical protein